MYSDIAELLDILELAASRDLRVALLALVLGISRAGLSPVPRLMPPGTPGAELLFRDAEGRQPFTASITPARLVFCLRRPLLDLQPGLALAAIQHFAARLDSDPRNLSEVRVKLHTLEDVEDLIAFLRLKPRLVSLGYGARISA